MKLVQRLITGTLLFWLILFTLFKGGIVFNFAIFLVSILNLYELNHVKGLKFISFPNLFLLFCYCIVFYLFLSLFAPIITASLLTKLFVVLIFLFVIEIFSPTRLFNRVDFPALVLPTRLIFNIFLFINFF